MKTGVIVCARTASRRLPRKVLLPVEPEGRSAIRVLAERLLSEGSGGYEVCVALTGLREDEAIYEELKDLPIKFFRGHPDNPLARMTWAAEEFGYDTVVRVTHDDILQSPQFIADMVVEHLRTGADYTYVSQCVRGMDAEVVSRDFLRKSYHAHPTPTEELSFVWRLPSLQANIHLFTPPPALRSAVSMSLDEEEDLVALRLLFSLINCHANGERIVNILKTTEIPTINKRPRLTVYTSAYNATDTLHKAIKSVQECGLIDYEHIIHNDGSTDGTASVMVALAGQDKRIVLSGTMDNRGLASSCNILLSKMSGEFCLRLDADDEVLPGALGEVIDMLKTDPLLMAVYPAYYRNGKITQNEEHHVGGAIIRTRVLKELRFCDGLRHWEGKEFYQRLSARHRTLEYSRPTWVYTNRHGSLSNTTCAQRRTSEWVFSPTTQDGKTLIDVHGIQAEKGTQCNP